MLCIFHFVEILFEQNLSTFSPKSQPTFWFALYFVGICKIWFKMFKYFFIAGYGLGVDEGCTLETRVNDHNAPFIIRNSSCGDAYHFNDIFQISALIFQEKE